MAAHRIHGSGVAGCVLGGGGGLTSGRKHDAAFIAGGAMEVVSLMTAVDGATTARSAAVHHFAVLPPPEARIGAVQARHGFRLIAAGRETDPHAIHILKVVQPCGQQISHVSRHQAGN